MDDSPHKKNRPRLRAQLSRMRFFSRYCMVLLFVYGLGLSAALAEQVSTSVPRVVLAFYDSQLNAETVLTDIHQSGEMPLNHLGLKVRYHDVQAALPSDRAMKDVRGILLWFATSSVPDPDPLLRWLIKQMQAGRSVVVMGSHAFELSSDGKKANPTLLKDFWDILGLVQSGEWISVTYDVKLQPQNGKMANYERSFSGVLPSFPIAQVQLGKATSYLKVMQPGRDRVLADIITIGPQGGYVAPGYERVFSTDEKKKYWFLDPFQFFRLAFLTDVVPKPDTTTLSGRRVYYSHIDGDGWRNLSLVPGYRENKKLSTEVILKEIFLKYPDLPVTVGPIAGDIDLNWFGTEQTQQLARDIFVLPNIEAASHTFTHPLSWGFFENYKPEHEEVFLDRYPATPGVYRVQAGFRGLLNRSKEKKASAPDSTRASKISQDKKDHQDIEEHYETPRVYHNGPYSLKEDIQGSLASIQMLLPEGKRVEVLQWSGNTLPFPEALRQTREAGVRNLNGGDTRFDGEFDSLNWVSPIGREVKGEQQIYASASNENTYTNLWTSRYYGFGYLKETLRRTETPIRLKPINIYYHMYSGERLASLNALQSNLSYAQSKQIAPITTSQFAAIGDGFFTTKFEQLSHRRWRIHQRGELQTIRFDRATFDAVDFSQSEGIVGQTHLHGSLYIALDPGHSAPVIALKTIAYGNHEPDADRPYLISGHWGVTNLELLGGGFQFQVKGFGVGHMAWYIPTAGRYNIQVKHADGGVREWSVEVGDDHWLDIRLVKIPYQYSTVRVERVHDAGT